MKARNLDGNALVSVSRSVYAVHRVEDEVVRLDLCCADSPSQAPGLYGRALNACVRSVHERDMSVELHTSGLSEYDSWQALVSPKNALVALRGIESCAPKVLIPERPPKNTSRKSRQEFENALSWTRQSGTIRLSDVGLVTKVSTLVDYAVLLTLLSGSVKREDSRALSGFVMMVGVDSFSSVMFNHLPDESATELVAMMEVLAKLLVATGIAKSIEQAVSDVIRSVELRVLSQEASITGFLGSSVAPVGYHV